MSSGFISASSDATGDEWVKAQQEVEERRREKAKEGQQADGKSLYEVLQANKGKSERHPALSTFCFLNLLVLFSLLA